MILFNSSKTQSTRFRKKVLATTLVVILLSSCSNSKESNQNAQSVTKNALVSYNLTEGLPSKRLAELVEDIEFTRLEETEESLLSYVIKYQIVNDKVVFANYDNGDVHVFTKSGQFVNKVNRQGEGPKEHSRIKDFWVDKETMMFFTTKNKIKKYSLTGEYIGSIDIGLDAVHLIPYNNGYLLDMNFNPVNDSLKYLLVSLNDQLEIEQMLLPYETRPRSRMVTDISTLYQSDGGISYVSMLSDTAFLYSEGNFRPFVHFDFGNNWFWKEGIRGVSTSNKPSESPEEFVTLNYKIGEKYFYLKGMAWSFSTESYLIDRLENKPVKINKRKTPDENYTLNISHWDKGYAYGTLSSVDIGSLIEELEESRWSFSQGTTLEEIESSENPVLIKVKFKSGVDW